MVWSIGCRSGHDCYHRSAAAVEVCEPRQGREAAALSIPSRRRGFISTGCRGLFSFRSRAHSSAGERPLHTREVPGSIPGTPIQTRSGRLNSQRPRPPSSLAVPRHRPGAASGPSSRCSGRPHGEQPNPRGGAWRPHRSSNCEGHARLRRAAQHAHASVLRTARAEDSLLAEPGAFPGRS